MVKQISAEEFDRMFDDGEDISDYVDWSSARLVNSPEPVEIAIPNWMVEQLDARAKQLGMTRQALLASWIEERLKAA